MWISVCTHTLQSFLMMLFDPLLLQYCCTHSAGKALLPKTATESSLLVHFWCTSPIVCCDMLLAMLATSEHSSYVVVPTLDMPTIESVGVCRQITYFFAENSSEVSAWRHCNQQASTCMHAVVDTHEMSVINLQEAKTERGRGQAARSVWAGLAGRTEKQAAHARRLQVRLRVRQMVSALTMIVLLCEDSS